MLRSSSRYELSTFCTAVSSDTVTPIILSFMRLNYSSVSKHLRTVGSALILFLASEVFSFVCVKRVVVELPIIYIPLNSCFTLEYRRVHRDVFIVFLLSGFCFMCTGCLIKMPIWP